MPLIDEYNIEKYYIERMNVGDNNFLIGIFGENQWLNISGSIEDDLITLYLRYTTKDSINRTLEIRRSCNQFLQPIMSQLYEGFSVRPFRKNQKCITTEKKIVDNYMYVENDVEKTSMTFPVPFPIDLIIRSNGDVMKKKDMLVFISELAKLAGNDYMKRKVAFLSQYANINDKSSVQIH